MRIVVVGALAMGAPAAVAQEGAPSPQELWDAYPLDPETAQSQAGASNGAPPPTGTAAGPAAQDGAAGTTDGGATTGEQTAESGESSLTVPALVGAALLAFAVGLAAGQASRRRTAGDAEPTAAATADGEQPAATANGERPAAAAGGERPAASAGARRAPRRRLRTAPPVPTPQPRVPAPQPPERPPPAFEWVEPSPREPAARPPAEPTPPPPAAPPPPEAEPVADAYAPEPEPFELPWRRFARDTPWPEAEELWTCEIGWKPGYLKSTFRALAAAPGERKRKAVAESPPLRWTLMMDPDPDLPEVAEAVRALAATIERAGWERTDPGEPWFAKRFVWRGDGRPPRIQSFSGGVNA